MDPCEPTTELFRWITGLMVAAIVALSGVVVFLWRENKQLYQGRIEMAEQAAEDLREMYRKRRGPE